jgi:hypothetical protein
MTTGSVGKAEFKHLLWEGYWRSVTILWRLKWPIVLLVVAIVAFKLIKH